MPEPLIIRPPKIPSCGNCHFGHMVSIGVTRCQGLPPQIVCLGTGRDLAGREGLRMEKFYPEIPSELPGCALHRFKTADQELGAAAVQGNG